MGRKSKELDPGVRKIIVNAHRMERNKSKLSRLLGIPRSTIKSVIKKNSQVGSVENQGGRGRKKLFTERDMSQLSRVVKRNRRTSLQDITNTINEGREHAFCTKTIRRKIGDLGYKRRSAKKKMVVKEESRRKRVVWCRERKDWSVEDHWCKWIFSDETQIVIGNNDKVFVWRKDDERYNPQLVCPAPRRKLSVMIWGCVCFHGIGTMTDVTGNINAQKYIDIVDNNLWPVIARHFGNNQYIFQQDNAPVHTARLTNNFMTENNINTTTWPAYSPDLNIIENVWLHIKRVLQKRVLHINSRDQLIAEIRDIWENIELDYVRSLYETIPARLKEVIRMKGHLTKY